MFRWLLLLFLVVPLVEIYVLIQVGSVVGALPTVLLVVLTAVLGAALMRLQGFSTLARVQASLNRGEIPATELVEGAILLVSGALLLTPGFVTDAVGFACLVPPWRTAMARWLLRRGIARFHVRTQGDTRRGRGERGRVIEGEYRRDDQ
ncbi:MAG: FxsA family protein [Gammaproteobacteria bacterium]|nr:FxsA family protein [Gammaproteobacteria bacterium]NIR85836.1 FxsA family protein [Gammaproteobacteria bacterium]NIR90590.1 FxsA family protein [Gammaproteobacteria bacterium]NIU06971.1 FxsA family protein [Gammaproteobacteria bacterium]NIV53901.1 FxsA family protein [Gammaproteobacteria bacterium]